MAVKIKDLNFNYPGKTALRNINLNFQKGDFVGITGSTGSGKTTLAYCLNGLIPHAIRGKFSGTVKIGGLDTKEHKITELVKLVGLVFQDPDWQLFSLSVKEEISFGLKNLKMKSIEKRVKKALKMVGLQGYEKTEPYKLSQGQKQKLCIASILAMEPDIIVLDEPVSQLDYKSTLNIYQILEQLNKEGRTIIVIEHNTDILAERVNKMVLIDNGRVVKQGFTKDVLSQKKLLKKLGIKVPSCLK